MITSEPKTNVNNFLAIISLILIGITIYYISNNLLYYYLYGDQFHYRRFYAAIYGEYLENIPKLQKDYLGGSEPIFGLLIWLGSNLEIDKDSYISFFNSLTTIFLIRWLMIKRVHLLIILLICTNFYFLVIMLSAERLKFSYLFLLILLNKNSFVQKNNKNSDANIFNISNLILIGCIILSHFQSILTITAYAVLVSKKYYHVVTKFLTFGRLVIFVSISIIIGSYIVYNQMDAIMSKFNTYSSGNKDILMDLSKALGLTALSAMISSNKREMLMMGGLMSCFVFILGGERLNMILVCMIIYAFTEENKLGHPLILMILCYFSYKSINFINNVYDFGDGFFDLKDQAVEK